MKSINISINWKAYKVEIILVFVFNITKFGFIRENLEQTMGIYSFCKLFWIKIARNVHTIINIETSSQ